MFLQVLCAGIPLLSYLQTSLTILLIIVIINLRVAKGSVVRILSSLHWRPIKDYKKAQYSLGGDGKMDLNPQTLERLKIRHYKSGRLGV